VKRLSSVRLFAVLACIAVAAPAGASVVDAGATDRVALDVPKDVAITAVASVGAIVPQLFSDKLAPKSCRWCDGPVGTPVNSLDDWFHGWLTAAVISRSTANAWSSYIAFGVTPAVALGGAFFATGPHATEGAGLRAAAIVLESVAVTGALTQAIKFSAGRQRPYVHYQHVARPGASGSSEFQVLSSEANLSFPSGHASISAALGTSAAMLATLQESPAAPWLWGAAGVLAVSTATLRMVSEAHYFTDVLAGTALGAGSGVLVPLLHRRGSWLGRNATPSVTASGAGASFSIAGAF